MLQNLHKYGVRMTYATHYIPHSSELLPVVCVLISMITSTWFAYYYEAKHCRSKHMHSYGPHIVNTLLAIAMPSLIAFWFTDHPALAGGMVLLASTLMLKVHSWAVTNWELKKASSKKEAKENEEEYPANVNPSNYLYFLAAPTFCYQISYPRTERVRPLKVVSLVVQLFASLALIVFIMEQYAVPTLTNSTQAFSKDASVYDILHLVYPTYFLERVLQLAGSLVPILLLMFYGLFHCYLNLLAELTRFADRSFYESWWNALSLADYWRTWNIPVHSFCKRHIYVPCRFKLGLSPMVSQLVVFAFSAIMHELLVAIPAKKVLGHAFIGFMLQLPLIILTEVLKNRRKDGGWVGNVIVWLVFVVVGWPSLALLYYHAWATRMM